MEEMRNKENQTEPQNSNNKFANQFENHFNLFGVVSPEPISKPAFESVREGTTTTIITTNTHVNNPLLYFLSILYQYFRIKARTFKRQKVDENMRRLYPEFHFAILNVSI